MSATAHLCPCRRIRPCDCRTAVITSSGINGFGGDGDTDSRYSRANHHFPRLAAPQSHPPTPPSPASLHTPSTMRSASGRFNLSLGRQKTPAQPVSDDAEASTSPVGSTSGVGHAMMGGSGHPDRVNSGSGGGGDLGKMIKSKVAHTTIASSPVMTFR
jgi:hypothetical protein